MKKNISSLLQRGNLTPKERYLLLIQNDITKAQTGKKILTEADEQAIIGWQAKTPAEAREWNKYNEGWKLGGRAGIEAEFIFMQTLAEKYHQDIINTDLIVYPIYRAQLALLQILKKKTNAKLAIKLLETLLKTTGHFKETKKGEETYLEFKNEEIKKVYMETNQSLIDGYAKLLAYREIFKKLNNIYEAETDHLLKQRIEQVSGFINQHNFNLDLIKTKMIESLYIKKDQIAPDTETLREWTQRFSDIFRDEF